MKKSVRVIAWLLILVVVFALMSSVAFAATSKSGRNLVVTVETGKSFWGNPTVKIKNTGSTAMTIVVEGYETISSLKPGKTVTIKLKPNSTYTIMWSGNFLSGAMNATGTITAGRAIKDIR